MNKKEKLIVIVVLSAFILLIGYGCIRMITESTSDVEKDVEQEREKSSEIAKTSTTTTTTTTSTTTTTTKSPKVEEDEFKKSCKTYTYKQLARNPDDYYFKPIKLTGEVVQAMYSSDQVDIRLNITKKGTYSTWYTDTVYVVYEPQKGESKILEDDIITVWGYGLGEHTYESVMGASITLPLISAKYIKVK